LDYFARWLVAAAILTSITQSIHVGSLIETQINFLQNVPSFFNNELHWFPSHFTTCSPLKARASSTCIVWCMNASWSN